MTALRNVQRLWLQNSVTSTRTHLPQIFADDLTAFARDSVKYVDTVFKPGGFTDRPETPSAYFGPPTPEKNKLWASLYDGESKNSRGLQIGC